MADQVMHQRTLNRAILLSLAAALTTMALKASAAAMTGSVGLLSDALESSVNLVGALVAMWALRVAAKPSDMLHQFGHGKAEYLSAALEGAMISIAAVVILWSAGVRLLHPRAIESAGIGLAITAVAAVINLAVGWYLIRVGKEHRSLTLVADGTHLLSDVVTSVGVLIGVGMVVIFKWPIVDPLIALAVGVYILTTGYGLLRRSVVGLLDAAIPEKDVAALHALLDRCRAEFPVDFHALRTRESGRKRFVYLHVLVPGQWTVKQGHDLAEKVSSEIAELLPGATTFAHIEPLDDPASYNHSDLYKPVPPLEEIERGE